MLFGGSLFRSAQFGVNDFVLTMIGGKSNNKMLGIFDQNVIIAGFAGGIGRGVVEGPAEFIKVRRQVTRPWAWKELFSGMTVTMVRNAFLFTSFVVNLDVLETYAPESVRSNSFLKGSIAATAAWIYVWPLDVCKSRRQSGLYGGIGSIALLTRVFAEGHMFRGLGMGLVRSVIANGCGLYVYTKYMESLRSVRL